MAQMLAIVTPKLNWNPAYEITDASTNAVEETVDKLGMRVTQNYDFLWATYIVNSEYKIENAIADFKKYFEYYGKRRQHE